MLQLIIRGIQAVGPVALGFVAGDLINWLGSLPLVGPFFSTRKQDGSAPWYVIVAALLLAYIALQFIIKKVFKLKSSLS